MRAIVPVNVLPGYAGTVNEIDRAVLHARDVRFGNGHHEPQPVVLFTTRTIGVVAAGPLLGPTSAPGWTLRSVTTPSNGAVTRRYPSICVIDSQRLPRGFDGLLCRGNLALVGLHRLLREDQIVARDDARRRRGRLEPVIGAGVGIGLRPCHRELRLGRLQLRLRLGALGQ